MIVNVYATSLLKHVNTDLIRKFLPNTKVSIQTCYTLKENDAFKHDQGKALESVVIPNVKKTKANIVCLENGVNETTKISRSGLNLKAMQEILRNKASALVDFAEKIQKSSECRDVVLIKMMPRFDKNVYNEDVKNFLQDAHQIWNKTVEDIIVTKNSSIKMMKLIDEKDIQYISKDRLYGNRDGIHFSGKDAPNILARKLERGVRTIVVQKQWTQLDRTKAQKDLQVPLTTEIKPMPRPDWNDIVEEDELLSGYIKEFPEIKGNNGTKTHSYNKIHTKWCQPNLIKAGLR